MWERDYEIKKRICQLEGIIKDTTKSNLRANRLFIYWDRGRLARNERAARSSLEQLRSWQDCAPLARCGRDARDPSVTVSRHRSAALL